VRYIQLQDALMKKFTGIDFGTTNSSIAVAYHDRTVKIAQFHDVSGFTETYRSILYFNKVRQGHRSFTRCYSGPEALKRYIDDEEKGRLIQSLKAFLPSTLIKSTEILGSTYLLQDLVSLLVRQLREKSAESLGDLGHRAVVGRPVTFSSRESNIDDALAMERLKEALVHAGVTERVFEYEPVAAAFYYESFLKKDELILVADFGGGTSDFSLLPVGPSYHTKVNREILGSEGLAMAGDAFDAKMVRYMVSPLLGHESFYKPFDKLLQVPTWIYSKLERWHHLSLLRNKETLDIIRSIRASALAPEKIEMLIYLIEYELGFQLHQAIQRTKMALSEQEASLFSFQVPGISISRMVTRMEFERWIEDELNKITCCIDRLLERSNVQPAAINRVFLTGGSSFVPAIRKIFFQRFGRERIASGSEFTSVAKGLALRSLVVHA
jgi:hypothetical chaperone protein